MRRVPAFLAVLLALGLAAWIGMREGLLPAPDFVGEGKGRGEGERPDEVSAGDPEAEDTRAAELRAAPAPRPRDLGPTAGHPSDGRAGPTTLRAAALAGSVVGPDGRPLGGARVTLTDVASGALVGEAVTDRDGAFRLETAVGRYDLRISAGREGVYVDRDVVVDGRGLSTTFRLATPATLVVEVTEQGRAVPATIVSLRESEDAAARTLALATTDGSGRAQLDDLFAATVVVEATTVPEGLLVRKKVTLAAGEAATVALALPARSVWSGTARSAESLAGVPARIEVGVNGADGVQWTVVGTSDLVGAFAIPVPAGKPNRLVVTASGHEPFPSSREAGAVLGAIAGLRAGSVAHDLLLRRGGVASGTVKGPDGHGVAGLELRIRPDRGPESVVGTDEAGRWRTDALAPGGYAVRVATAGWYPKASPARFVLPPPGPSGPASVTFDLEVVAAGAIAGTVTLADGNPAAGARVWLVGGQGVVRGARQTGRALEAFSGPDGAYAIDDVPPMPGVRVRATWGDAEAVPSDPVAVTVGGAVVVRLVVAPTVRLVGRVTDLRTGEPVAGARVTVEPIGPPAARGGGNATTDAQGRYELPNRIPGTWRVVPNKKGVYLPGEAKDVVLSAGGAAFTADLTLDPGHPIAGVVFDEAGAAVAGVRATLSGAEDGAPAGQTVSRNATTDAAGAFRFLALRTGRYTLTLARRGLETVTVPLRGGEDRLRIGVRAAK